MNAPQKKLLPAIVLAALIAGTLDGLGAITSYLLQGGRKPETIFKFISSGVFGKTARMGGMEMVVTGVLFHYFIALFFTAFYFLIFPKIKWISGNAWLSGILYGIGVWVVMNLVVLQLSAVPPSTFTVKKVLIGVSILILCIGIPISLMARKYYLYEK